MRAILLASTTVTSLAGFLASSHPVETAGHVPALVTNEPGGADHQQAPEVAVAGLGDGTQSFLAAGRVLSRHHPQPGRKLAPGLEGGWIGHAGYDRRGDDRADPGNGGEPTAGFVP